MRWISAATLALATLLPAHASAQWSSVHEQTYLPAQHNWEFRKTFSSADRLFNAFDYGHAILYETLYTKPAAPVSVLEEEIYDRLTRRVLVNPPRVPLEESAIEVEYAKLVPEARVMFDWAHVLHRQVYDVWADESIPLEQKDARVAELVRYYKARPDIAFSSQPKSMDLMEGQYYSTAFRERYPKFNGLIWAYHWLQIGLYEPLLTGTTLNERKAGVDAAVARFWQMLEDAPERMPRVMPMTAAVSPAFASRYPDVAIIFDNLHSLHDVISDVLASPKVPRNRKRDEILQAAARYRDDTSFVMTQDEWLEMSHMMGVENMGGPAVGLLASLPQPTAQRGGAHGAHGQKADTVLAEAQHMEHAQDDSAAVVATLERFHRALAQGDSTTVMNLLSADATVVEAGGIETRAEYSEHHLPGDIAFARAVPSERTLVRVAIYGDAALAISSSTVRGRYRDRDVDSQSSELAVLTRGENGWLISAIHWSSRSRR